MLLFLSFYGCKGMLRFSKFSIHIRKRLTIFHEAYARYRYNFASQVSHVHVHVLCFSVFVLQKIDQQSKEKSASFEG
ncbi:hypothetical protein NC651_016735 [Populus alba x Populus x berolinensis]|nr:hypothetical protein NC651_016735 [Populus alba x Populus x berolinensis]